MYQCREESRSCVSFLLVCIRYSRNMNPRAAFRSKKALVLMEMMRSTGTFHKETAVSGRPYPRMFRYEHSHNLAIIPFLLGFIINKNE